MKCRSYCGACCIAPSISSPIPGMPNGKPANTKCVQLNDHFQCKIFTSPLRPQVCGSLKPSNAMCGKSKREALIYLSNLEDQTAP